MKRLGGIDTSIIHRYNEAMQNNPYDRRIIVKGQRLNYDGAFNLGSSNVNPTDKILLRLNKSLTPAAFDYFTKGFKGRRLDRRTGFPTQHGRGRDGGGGGAEQKRKRKSKNQRRRRRSNDRKKRRTKASTNEKSDLRKTLNRKRRSRKGRNKK